jgi:hypothetical protein
MQITRTLVYDVLSRPFSSGCIPRKWTYQGLGMVRTALDADGVLRLNVWNDHLRVPNISSIHDHPWTLKSYILNGQLLNRRYDDERHAGPAEGREIYPAHGVKLGCGAHPNGAHLGEPFDTILYPKKPEVYRTGECYYQHRDEIHQTQFGRSAVSLNIRTDRREDGSATVYWPHGTEWVDAAQREATFDEVNFSCWEAVQLWEDY